MKQYMEQGTPSSGFYDKCESDAEAMPAQWVLVLVSGVLAGLALLLAVLYWWQFGQSDSPSLTPVGGGAGRSVIADSGRREFTDGNPRNAATVSEYVTS